MNLKDKKWFLLSYNSLDTRAIGGLRMARLAEYLREKGVDAQIVVRYSSKKEDWSIPNFFHHKFIRKPLSFLIAPDGFLFWAIKAFWKLRKKSGVIITSVPPHSLHISGLLLKKFTKKFYWIADFRDPWTLNALNKSQSWKFKTWFYKEKINNYLEAKVFKKADLLILNTETDLKDYRKKYPQIPEEKTIFIRNGFDKLIPSQTKIDKNKIRFVYSGSTDFGKALRRINEVLEVFAGKGVQFICDYYGDQPIGIESCQYIENKGILKANEVAETLTKYHFGFAYLQPENLKSGRILQKFYDYLGSSIQPIVLNPSLEMDNILTEINFGFPIHSSMSKEEIFDALKIALNRTELPKNIEKYSRESQFSKLWSYLSV